MLVRESEGHQTKGGGGGGAGGVMPNQINGEKTSKEHGGEIPVTAFPAVPRAQVQKNQKTLIRQKTESQDDQKATKKDLV